MFTLNDQHLEAVLAGGAIGGGVAGAFVRWRLGHSDVLLRFIAAQQVEITELRARITDLEAVLAAKQAAADRRRTRRRAQDYIAKQP